MEFFEKLQKVLKGEKKANSQSYFKPKKIIKRRMVDEAIIQRHSDEYKKWRKEIFRRDKRVCQRCGRTNCRINAHHILGFKKHKKYRFVLSNGVTLCSKCHRKFHEQYGKSNFPDITKVWKLNERD